MIRLYRSDLPVPPAWPGDEQSIADALRWTRLHDPYGHQLHNGFAMLYMLLLPWITAPKDVAFVLLVGYAMIRLPNTWRCYGPLVRSPLTWAFVAWIAWCATTALWSRDPEQAWDELSAMRVLLTPFAMWPVLDRLPMHLGAALLGVLAQQGCQLLDFMGWVDFRVQDAQHGRVGGWIHPIHTGTWCMAALCWHLAAALTSRGWMRAISIGLLFIAGLGLVATQSRGPWLASAVAVPATLVVIAIRRPDSRVCAMILVITAVVVGAGLLAWPVGNEMVTRRLDEAVSDVKLAVNEQAYWTPIGLRIGQAKWAWELYADHPVRGVGLGSFKDAMRELDAYQKAEQRARDRDRDLIARMRRDHPHSMYLHSLACTGLIGTLLMVMVMVLLIIQVTRDRLDHPWAMGTIFVLIGWLIGALFDCHELNGHTFGLMGYVAAATLTHRARIRYDLRPGRPAEIAQARAGAGTDRRKGRPRLRGS